MSYIPSDGELYREAIGGREVEADLVTREYAHLHPEADEPAGQTPGLWQRLTRALKRRPPK